MTGDNPNTVIVARGGWGTVECAIRHSGECPAYDFLTNDCEQLREKGKDKPQSTARARLMVLFQQMANYGHVSPKRFKPEMDGLFGFSHEVRNVQVRFPCFQDGNRWILTHGFNKPGAQSGLGKWPEEHVQRAKDIRSEYKEQQSRDTRHGSDKGKRK